MVATVGAQAAVVMALVVLVGAGSLLVATSVRAAWRRRDPPAPPADPLLWITPRGRPGGELRQRPGVVSPPAAPPSPRGPLRAARAVDSPLVLHRPASPGLSVVAGALDECPGRALTAPGDGAAPLPTSDASAEAPAPVTAPSGRTVLRTATPPARVVPPAADPPPAAAPVSSFSPPGQAPVERAPAAAFPPPPTPPASPADSPRLRVVPFPTVARVPSTSPSAHGGWEAEPDPPAPAETALAGMAVPVHHGHRARPIEEPSGPEILLVEDDEAAVSLYRLILESRGYRVRHAADGDEALARVEEGPPDLVLIDTALPLEVLDAILARPSSREVPVVLLCDADDADLAERALRRGAVACLEKAQARPQVVARAVPGWLRGRRAEVR